MITNKYIQIILLLLLSSCAGNSSSNYTTKDLQTDNLNIITQDIATTLTQEIANKKTLFVITPDEFGKLLANELRKNGFEVMFTDQAPPENAMLVRYIIDWHTSNSIYIALTLNDSLKITKTYGYENNQLTVDATIIKGMRDE